MSALEDQKKILKISIFLHPPIHVKIFFLKKVPDIILSVSKVEKTYALTVLDYFFCYFNITYLNISMTWRPKIGTGGRK